MHWWGAVLMAIGMVAFWGLVIWAVWYFVTAIARDTHREPPSESPKQILDQRLARGEIDVEEYRRLRQVMSSEEAAGSNGHQPVGAGDPR